MPSLTKLSALALDAEYGELEIFRFLIKSCLCLLLSEPKTSSVDI